MDEALPAQLTELLTAIQAYPDPRRASTEWKQVYRLLEKTPLETRQYQGTVGRRDVDGLAQLIDQLTGLAGGPAPTEAPDPAVCKRALQAFRKRAKLTQLDDESQLGRSPLSKGSAGEPVAIQPPDEWPEEVWRELVHQGKLRDVGGGLYALARGS